MGYRPNITFLRNSDDWEKHKLSDFMSFSNGFNGGKELYGNGVKYISVMDILNNDYIKYDNIQGLVKIDDDTFARFCVNYGDVLFQRSSENIDDAGKSNVYIDDTPAAFGGFVIRGKRIAEFDPFFMKHLLDSGKVRKQITAKAQGAQHINVSQEILSDIKIYTPMTEQQLSIGALFRNVNNLIATHKQKQDELIRVKKYMLQKMFPKNGERVPEVRFAGFTDDLEQRKVTDLGEIYIGLVTTMTSHYTDHGALLIRNSDIKDGRFEFGDNPIYLDDEFAKQNASRKHKVGDVITVHTGDIGTSAVISDKEAGSIGFATIVTRPNREKIISEYLCAFLNTDTHKNFAMNISTGDGRNNYNLKDYYECVVPVPSVAEQKKISSFIAGLNNLITLHQRKCEDLKELKKYMLQNMFPTKG